MIRVTAVHPGSIADELGLVPGSELLAVNGRELHDFLDWEFLTADEAFLLHVRQPDGEERTVSRTAPGTTSPWELSVTSMWCCPPDPRFRSSMS